MRLAAQAKMGYYPTPPMVVSLITGILVRDGPGKIRIFDPCAGEGHALNEIKDSLQWDAHRFGKVSALAGDNFQSVIICEGTFIDRYRLIGGIISL